MTKPEPTYPIFTCSYRFEGATWTVEIPAKDHAEAERRLAALQWGQVDGEVVMRIPAAVPGSAWWVRLTCWWRNCWWSGR